MGMKANETEEELKKRFKELCSDLNLDKTSADEAWTSYQRIGINYTLEGDQLHWLSCAVYVACRKCVTQTVGKVVKIEGNLVSLTRLLRSCRLSLVQFFNKMKKWSDMANLSAEMRQKVDHLERNFNVSTVIFKKYKPIFEHVFKDPSLVVNKQAKNRKQSRKQSVSSADIFSFCWTLFIHIKSNFPQISDDLVNSYHLLLASIDYCFANALLVDNAKELLNQEFSELPKELSQDNFKPEKQVCIIQALCEKWDGISVEAKTIKEHWCKPCIKRMVEKDVIRTKNNGLFDISNFENNNKHIMKEYDQYVLNFGDFDERIFLNENAAEELGTPQANAEELAELVQSRQNSKYGDNNNVLVPNTPLTNRQYLSNRPNACPMTPIASATNSVSRLQSILLDRSDEPNEALELLFKQCIRNPKQKILAILKAMGDRFLTAYNNDMQSSPPSSRMSSEEMRPPSPAPNAQNDEFAKKRLKLSISFYYKALENILLSEKKRIPAEKWAESLTAIMEKESFHLSLFGCSFEIILFSYNSKQTFPWILDVFSEGTEYRLHAFNFYKVIEPIIRDEDGLSRDVVKHLNSIEEKILESMAWKSDSPLWEAIKSGGPGPGPGPGRNYVPSCQEVSLPMNSSGSTPSSVFNSPVSHLKKQDLQSTSGSLTDRFSSPFKSSAKRQLFGSTKADSPSTSSNVSQQGQIVQMMIPARIGNGEIQYIQVPAIQLTTLTQQSVAQTDGTAAENTKPVKAGPIGLFFRKVYTMAGLRLRDLCDRLNISDEDIRRKIWTCFEHSLRQHTDLMRDRHLDQIIMCAFYAICKVAKLSQTFQDIMKCYRLQPQAASHVYRSVLLTNRRRRNSGSSDTSRHSGSSSPLIPDDKVSMRSSSTLPVPHPNSQPPTPTRVAGTGSQFEFEERGDVIMFYNNVYLPELTTKYIMKFAPNISESPPLSPLPRLHANPMSPYRKISDRFPLYISPLKNANFPPSPNRPMSYRFQSSPAKDLRAINNMMRSGSSSQRVSKRIFPDDTESENSPTKRQCTEGTLVSRKLNDIISERKSIASNGALTNGNTGVGTE